MKKQPQWVYRIEALDPAMGLWYNDSGDWVFEEGIGQTDSPSRDLPMDYDERYQKDGKNWHSAGRNAIAMSHWFSRESAKDLMGKGYQLYRYLATEYIHYEFETCFIKETCLNREVVDYREVWGYDSLGKGEEKPEESLNPA